MAINTSKNRGVSLIELIIAMAIASTALVSVLAALSYSLKVMLAQENVHQANFLAKETVEGIRSFRDNTDWSVDGLGSLTMGASYHLEKQGDPAVWALISGEHTESGFTQRVILDNARRDGSDNIIDSGGVLDANTKKAKVVIEWTERGHLKQIEAFSYFTNWH